MTDETNMAKAFAEHFTNGTETMQKGCTVQAVASTENDEEYFLIKFSDNSAVKVYPDMVDLATDDE